MRLMPHPGSAHTAVQDARASMNWRLLTESYADYMASSLKRSNSTTSSPTNASKVPDDSDALHFDGKLQALRESASEAFTDLEESEVMDGSALFNIRTREQRASLTRENSRKSETMQDAILPRIEHKSNARAQRHAPPGNGKNFENAETVSMAKFEARTDTNMDSACQTDLALPPSISAQDATLDQKSRQESKVSNAKYENAQFPVAGRRGEYHARRRKSEGDSKKRTHRNSTRAWFSCFSGGSRSANRRTRQGQEGEKSRDQDECQFQPESSEGQHHVAAGYAHSPHSSAGNLRSEKDLCACGPYCYIERDADTMSYTRIPLC